MTNFYSKGFLKKTFQIKEGLIETTNSLKMGPVTEFDSFMSAGKKNNIKMIYFENFFLFRIKKLA